MAHAHTRKSERLELRVPAEVKDLAVKAAELSGVSLSSYVLDVIRREALAAIQSHRDVKLTLDQWNYFTEVLRNPPAPNEKLRHAASMWKELQLDQQHQAPDGADPGAGKKR